VLRWQPQVLKLSHHLRVMRQGQAPGGLCAFQKLNATAGQWINGPAHIGQSQSAAKRGNGWRKVDAEDPVRLMLDACLIEQFNRETLGGQTCQLVPVLSEAFNDIVQNEVVF
jgi:hypothetical protein